MTCRSNEFLQSDGGADYEGPESRSKNAIAETLYEENLLVISFIEEKTWLTIIVSHVLSSMKLS